MQKYRIPFSPPDITRQEEEAVLSVLRSGWLTTGEETKQFEKELAEYTGADRVACFSSGTAALELTLRLLGIGERDEVITSAYTYTATAAAILHSGARPVLVDTSPGSYFMDYDKVAAAVTPRTKAIIPVDIAGVPADYDRLFEIADAVRSVYSPKNDLAARIGRLAVIADAAHSLGAKYRGRNVGSLADITCCSFHAVKNLTTGEGGAAFFSSTDGKNTEEMYRQYMQLSLHGQSKDALAKSGGAGWEYDILSIGWKYNMTDIAAALGRVQLKRYPALLARRRELATQYASLFSGSMVDLLPHFTDDYISSCHLCITRLSDKNADERNRLISELAKRGIAANVHYKPLPLFTAYRRLGFHIRHFPNAAEQYENELTLPLHSLLTENEVNEIASAVLELL